MLEPASKLDLSAAVRSDAAVDGCFEDDVAFPPRHTGIRPCDLNLRCEFRQHDRVGGVASRLKGCLEVLIPVADRFCH
jgi:hypothetical protein